MRSRQGKAWAERLRLESHRFQEDFLCLAGLLRPDTIHQITAPVIPANMPA